MLPVFVIEPLPSEVVVIVVDVVEVVVVVVVGFPELQPGNSSLQMHVYPVSSALFSQVATVKSQVLLAQGSSVFSPFFTQLTCVLVGSH